MSEHMSGGSVRVRIEVGDALQCIVDNVRNL